MSFNSEEGSSEEDEYSEGGEGEEGEDRATRHTRPTLFDFETESSGDSGEEDTASWRI